MKVSVGNRLRITHPTEMIISWCRDNLVIPNPEFYKKEKMGKWTGGIPRNLVLYEVAGDEIWIPFGCLKTLWKIYPYKDAYKLDFPGIRRFDYHSHISLYPYQEVAVVDAVQGKNGILVMPCGAGKTQAGLEIIARIGGRALWLTHTQDLLTQSKRRAESVLGSVGAGTITAGKVHLGSGITFATVQTLCKVDLSTYQDYWDVVIVDECQHCAGSPTRVTQFYKVMSSLCARYKLGLTATPERADGLEISMFALLGGIVHEVGRDAVASATCPIEVTQINTGWYPADDVLGWDGTIDYAKVLESLTHDEGRFQLVRSHVDACKGATIVLASRVEYLQRMAASMEGKRASCLSGMGQSKKAKEERKEALRKLNDGKLDIIFATYQLAAEGLDVPNLRNLVLATPEKNRTTVVQSVGRVGRAAPGKDIGIVLDFVDDFGMYQGWAKKRASYYAAMDVKKVVKK